MNALICLFFITYGIYALMNNIRFWIIYLSLLALYYYLTQVKYFKTAISSIRRKIIVALWGPLNDPQLYAKVKLDITKIEPYLAEKSLEIGEKLTLTIFTIKLISLVLKRYPDLYGYIRFGKFFIREDIDICCLVAVGDGEDLANTVIKNADRKSFKQICTELHAGAEKLRAKKNLNHNKKMSAVNFLPTFLIGPIMQVSSYLASIGISVNFLGVKGYEFGSCVLTSIGSLGIESGFPPIPPLTFAPLIVSVCKKKTKYYYDDNKQIKEKSTINLDFTIDTRFLSAKDAEGFHRDLKQFGENPEIFEEQMNRMNLEEAVNKKEN